MSRAGNSYTDIKTNKPKKKKKKKQVGLVGKNPFIATLESIKKEMGVPEITREQFWSMQRNVSNILNCTTVLRLLQFCNTYRVISSHCQ
jgi:hypothetical protein